MTDALYKIAMENTQKQNNLEDEISMERYGCTWDELDYDDKELVSFEAIDRIEG